MTLSGWTWPEILPVFAAGAAAITALYLLRMRRRQVVVPFAALWQQVTRESDTRRLWKKLRRLLSWLLQLVLLALLCLALGDPRPESWLRDPQTVAIVVDRSASVAGPAAGEPGVTRLDVLLRRARAEIAGLGPTDRALVIAAGAEVEVPGPLGRDAAPLLRALDTIASGPGEADLGRALALARAALAGQPGGRILVLTDGALDDAASEALAACISGHVSSDSPGAAPLPCQVARAGGPADNLALVAFAARRYPGDRERIEVLAEVHNLGDGPASAVLEVQADGLVVGRQAVQLGPGERKREVLRELDAARTRLVANLSLEPGADPQLLGPPDDDRAFAVVPPLPPFKVVLVTDGSDLFLEAALLTLQEHIQLTGIGPDDATTHPSLAEADLVIIDIGERPLPDPLPASDLVIFDPARVAPDAAPIRGAGELARPFLTEQQREHPLLDGVVLKDVNLRRGTRLATEPGDTVLVRSLGEPLVVLRHELGGDGRRPRSVLAFGFDPRQTDLPLRTAFPILVANIITYFEQARPGFVASVPVGASRPIAAAEIGLGAQGLTQVEVRGPEPAEEPTTVPVDTTGVFRLRAMQPGIYRVRAGDGAAAGAEVLVAVNQASVAASDLHDRLGDLPPDATAGEAPTPVPVADEPLWALLLLAAALLIALEWAAYHRRVTV
ncbi:VWA domain-containing protein [Nannocystis sp. SCPEA4]|uniref:vWA domain-containing protein n=1 Tax=Nannocystis sp. SCPEA4 TaxID=2996787 RepID=UPI00226DC5A2|nr:VWA domain-containing protein [Nannocystis sp. SCPEA4]MCY1061888.1 VWA domain-containing protein [Nannocystis sp. SCPEA4]